MEHAAIHIPILSIVPFILILLCIALFPLFAPFFWHRHYPKISLLFLVPMGIYVINLNWHWFAHTALEYVSFIVLLGSLFVIAGGIFIRGNLVGKPGTNSVIIAIGGILASFIGTTGASMLLIRPLLRANVNRPQKFIPVMFFIFVVSNMGGLLTPLGDPPLFLGFLKGVPFFWTMKLIPQWLFGNGLVLIVYFLIDSQLLKRKGFVFEQKSSFNTLGIDGSINFIFLAGVLAIVIVYGQLPISMGLMRDVFQVLGMGFFALLSILLSPKAVREANNFTYAPIKEVAILFAAIFTCMIPALKLLELKGSELGVTEPWHFFWLTGILSGFLDNAPTYLTFLSLGKTLPQEGLMLQLIGGEGAIRDNILQAISLGAVFMGALTYIGNGPNFMVKAIAEENKVAMPTFVGYLMYSLVILLPIFLLFSWLFL